MAFGAARTDLLSVEDSALEHPENIAKVATQANRTEIVFMVNESLWGRSVGCFYSGRSMN